MGTIPPLLSQQETHCSVLAQQLTFDQF